MDDLDELLADLESTSNQLKASKPPSESRPQTSQTPTSPIYTEIQNGNLRGAKNTSRFPTGISQPEPLYEPQQRQIPSGDNYIYAQPHATQNNNSSNVGGFSQSNVTYSSIYTPKSAATNPAASYTSASPPPKPARHRSPVAPSPQQGTAFTYPDAYNNKTYQSTKMANLSELDSLLKDLETAQFQIQNTPAPAPAPTHSSPSKAPPPTVAPKPKKSGRGPNADYTNDQKNIIHQGPSPGMTSYLQATTVDVQHSAAPQAPAQPLTSNNHPQQPTITQPPPRSASSATRELDDLMASLSDFQLSSSQPSSPQPAAIPTRAAEPNYAQPHKLTASTEQTVHASQAGVVHADAPQVNNQQQQPGMQQQQQQQPQQPQEAVRGNQLDSMLGHLQTDMNRQGVTTVAKGACAACEKQIVGQIVTALGQTWHPEHFVCHQCQSELGTQNFFERESRAYCEKDYHELFSPRCAYCNGAILDKCVTAMDKTWHPEHFFCAQCGKPFGDDGFHEKNGKPYCKDDYFDMFAPKCGGCQRPIMENYITALNVQWHAECFVCGECRTPFNGSSFFDHGGIPYCEIHYHSVRGSLCAGCNKPITGRCITAMQKKFHPEHFVCAFCLKQLNKGTFKEQNDKSYCHPCFVRLFS
ncbi:paxillin-like isoform X2 [Amphiura filiformis]|uniref:paxillin-like isoform X2 n=1 Tax=Amphiura filiformis TaxID=82378 RepID=UPI003B227A75